MITFNVILSSHQFISKYMIGISMIKSNLYFYQRLVAHGGRILHLSYLPGEKYRYIVSVLTLMIVRRTKGRWVYRSRSLII